MASVDILSSSTVTSLPSSEAQSHDVDLVDLGLLDTEPPIAIKSDMFEDLETTGDDAMSGSLEESVSTSESCNECKICK